MKNVCLVVFACLVFSCNSNTGKTKQNETMNSIHDFTLIGKKAKITYPEFIAEPEYLSDSTLHWKTTNSNTGAVATGDEKMFYKPLGNGLFFLSWIEQDGLTVSQVIDLNQMTVTGFGSWHDEESERGRRSGGMLEGKFEFVE